MGNGDQTDVDFIAERGSKVTVTVRVREDGTLFPLGQVDLTVSGGLDETFRTYTDGSTYFFVFPGQAHNLNITPSFGDYLFSPPSVALPSPLTQDTAVEFVATRPPSTFYTRFVTSHGMFNSDGSAYTTLQSLGPYSRNPISLLTVRCSRS